jgi:tetratricopeptide (TPR) repeat protein
LATGDAPQSTKAGAVFELKTFDAGRFVVQRLLGEGGQKTVYLARDSQLDRDVAIAVIKTQGLDEAGLVRVRREAQTLAGLGAQPHIVAMYDIRQEPASEGPPVPYLVCEYMGGGDLDQTLRQAGGPLPVERALAIAEDLTRALVVAHGRGIVHRDIKPANVWLTEDGTAKLGDFGLAMALGHSRMTQAGTIMGTASYMPPEQALGGEATSRSDLYSLGCVLYEMVTGRPPFLGADSVAVISQHINTAPIAPSWHNQQVPHSLEALIVQLLAKAPDDRPASAQAVGGELRRIAERSSEEPATAPPVTATLRGLEWGHFVGRRDEMDQLKTALENGLSGRGSLVMLVGEPGIGKTRLAEEFSVYAALRGAQVLTGRCYEGEVALPYRPFVEAFRQYVRERSDPELRQELGEGAPEIAKLVSEVRQRFPDIPEAPPLEAEAERLRLFESVATFARNAAQAQPLLLFLDDIHWADKPSLLLMRYLTRALANERVLLLAAYRDIELDRSHPLAEVLAAIRREQPYERVRLRGLSQDDVLALLNVMESSEETAPGRGLLAGALYSETEGNPFFIREVLNHLIEEGKIVHEGGHWVGRVASVSELGIPEGVREVIGRRLSRLSDGCNRMLTCASTMTGGCTWDELKAITGEPESALLDLLDEALGAQVLRERKDSSGVYEFTHALIRQTLYDELNTPRRVLLHRQIGKALEELYAANVDAHLGELAHHFYQSAPGGDVDKAIDYATRAGDRATLLVAWEEAVSHYGLALQALELKDPPEEGRRCELLLALTVALDRAGDYRTMMPAAQEAAAIARTLGDVKALVRAAFAVHDAEYTENPLIPSEHAMPLLEEALEALGNGDSELRAGVLQRLATSLWITGPTERARELGTEGAEMVRRLPHPTPSAFFGAHISLQPPEYLEQRLAIANDLVRLGERTGDKRALLRGYGLRRHDLAQLGDMESMERDNETHFDLARQLRLPLQMYMTQVARVARPMLEGRFEEAERLMQEHLATGERIQSEVPILQFGAQLATLRLLQGRLGELEATVQNSVARFPDFPVYRCLLCVIYGETDKLDELRDLFGSLATDGFDKIPKNDFWLINVDLLIEACTVLEDAAAAPQLYELLLPYANRNVTLGLPMLCTGSASRLLGKMATVMERWDDAERHFEEALAFNQEMNARPWVADTQWRYAGMLARRDGPGDRERALELLTSALGTAQELGMKKVIERASAFRLELEGPEPASL